MSEASANEPAERTRTLLQRSRTLLTDGRVDEADRVLAQAEALGAAAAAPDLAPLRLEIASLMADGYLRSGRVLPALGHLQQAVLLGAGAQSQELFLSLLFQVRFPGPHPTVKPIVQRALEESWIDPVRTGRLASTLLMLEPGLRALQPPASADPDDDWRPGLDAPPVFAALADPLLLSLLDRTLVVDVALERVLVGVRRALLHKAMSAAPSLDARLQPFAAALANQAFATEYAYPVSTREAEATAALAQRCVAAAKDEGPDPLELVVLAAYRGLDTLKQDKRLLAWDAPAWVRPVLARQVAEPAEEARLKRRIPALTAVEDAGSRAVAAQYEENPFPRWIGPPARRPVQTLAGWLRQSYPAAREPIAPTAGARPQVLVAGCGTGQETAILAAMLPGTDILAVDLSRASLAHARRRCTDLGLTNVEFARADILEAESLDRRFELVVSAGVLHHLDDPLAGWRALRDVTRPGGALLIALYSRQARRHVESARAFAAEGGHDASPQGLRRFRADVLALYPAPPWRADLLNRDDFYSLSMLRDLIFHVRETAFDIDGIEAGLADLGLRFAGFAVRPEVARLFQARFGPAADPLSLAQWRTFEAETPDAFWHMYHFLAERPEAPGDA